MTPMRVEIWSDVVCPWCYLGKRRFEKALAEFPHRDEVEVTWRAFELDPGAPAEHEGGSAERTAAKYGITVEEARARRADLVALGAAEGLDYDFDRARSGNTFDAHRVISLAAEQGLQDQVLEALMHGYFTDGEPIGDRETLVRLAADAGLDAELVRAALEDGARTDEVRTDEELAGRFGIRGVPFFVLDRHYGISGAQPAEALLAALMQAWEEREETAAA